MSRLIQCRGGGVREAGKSAGGSGHQTNANTEDDQTACEYCDKELQEAGWGVAWGSPNTGWR